MRRLGLLLIALFMAGTAVTSVAQEHPAVEHAKRIFALMQQEKFDEVSKEFTPDMLAALPPDKFREVWAAVLAQVGTFSSFIDQQVALPGKGITAVILGCRFEKSPLNVIVSFDVENKVAGLTFVPRKP